LRFILFLGLLSRNARPRPHYCPVRLPSSSCHPALAAPLEQGRSASPASDATVDGALCAGAQSGRRTLSWSGGTGTRESARELGTGAPPAPPGRAGTRGTQRGKYACPGRSGAHPVGAAVHSPSPSGSPAGSGRGEGGTGKGLKPLGLRSGGTGTLGAQGVWGRKLPHAVGVTGREAATRGAEPLWGGRQADGHP